MAESQSSTATLPGGCKPSKVCSTDKTRPILTHGYVRDVDGSPELHATNSYMAVRIPLRVDGAISEGLISGDALKQIESAKPDSTFSAANGRVELDGGRVSFARPELGDFPDLQKLWPTEAAKKPLTIGLNAKMLYQLAQSMGSETVAFELDMENVGEHGGYRKPYRVRPLRNTGHGTEGLLMPIVVDL